MHVALCVAWYNCLIKRVLEFLAEANHANEY